jgi:hypothetical protein
MTTRDLLQQLSDRGIHVMWNSETEGCYVKVETGVVLSDAIAVARNVDAFLNGVERIPEGPTTEV